MGLYELWKEDPAQIREKRVEQIIGFAGDGKLGDKNTAPAEFRAFLARVPVDLLARYAEECLSKGFTDSGMALQDIVNEIASRLGFKIEYGRYRGTKNEIGHDGIWSGPDGLEIVAEVKTSDALSNANRNSGVIPPWFDKEGTHLRRSVFDPDHRRS